MTTWCYPSFTNLLCQDRVREPTRKYFRELSDYLFFCLLTIRLALAIQQRRSSRGILPLSLRTTAFCTLTRYPRTVGWNNRYTLSRCVKHRTPARLSLFVPRVNPIGRETYRVASKAGALSLKVARRGVRYPWILISQADEDNDKWTTRGMEIRARASVKWRARAFRRGKDEEARRSWRIKAGNPLPGLTDSHGS